MMIVLAIGRGANKRAIRERHGSEYVAGIVFLNRYTFLLRNRIFGSLNQKLGGTHDANYRENAERNGQKALPIIGKARGRIKGVQHGFRNVAFAATAAIAIGHLFHDLATQENRFNHLYNCGGGVLTTRL